MLQRINLFFAYQKTMEFVTVVVHLKNKPQGQTMIYLDVYNILGESKELMPCSETKLP